MPITPKKAVPNNVRSIRAAGHGGGRKSSVGYDPQTGREQVSTNAENDLFATDNEASYRADRFYTRSVDSRGHGERLQVRVPQGIDTHIFDAISKTPEYRTLHDFFRDAAIHRLEWLNHRGELAEEGRRYLEVERKRADSERRQQDAENMKDAVIDLETKLQQLWDYEDYSLLREELNESSALVDWLRNPYAADAQRSVKKFRDMGKSKFAEIDRQRKDEEN